MVQGLFDYDAWPSRAVWAAESAQGESEYDRLDFHVDLGCGKVCKARIGVDRWWVPGVNVVADLDRRDGPLVYGLPDAPGGDAAGQELQGNVQRVLYHGLPFPDSSIRSIISHHFFEHVGEGFIPLVDEIYRVLEPGGILRAITPLFPSTTSVEDPDHRRMFMEGTWDSFCGTPEHHWQDSFSVPYSRARFLKLEQSATPIFPSEERWTQADRRELRVALRAVK